VAAVHQISVEDYLELEKTAEVRHEFVYGQMLAMAGSNLLHNKIVFNIRAALEQAARVAACQIATESLKVMTQPNRYRYPDVVVGCGENPDQYVIAAPCFIAEVQSDSTAETDNGAKLEEYTKLPSLQRYAIIAQKSRQVVLYKRIGETWVFEVLLGDGEVDVPCLGAVLTLEEIYVGLELQ
jgi:Uma2 family endonuclease